MTMKQSGTQIKIAHASGKRSPPNSSHKKHEWDTQQDKSWRAPITMLSSLLIGVGIALAHHFTYSYLDQRPVASINTSQAWISRIGTGLAFAVKLAFVICVGAAFIQHQWLRLRHQEFKVGEIDCLTSILGNFLALFDNKVWLKHPSLTLMALCAWTIPLSAVVAPGSLSVNSFPVTNVTDLQVPQLYYAGGGVWGGFGGASGMGPVYETGDLTKLAFSTAASGRPADLRPQFINQTYHLTFAGPAVKCGSASSDMILNYTKRYGPQRLGGNLAPYLAWVGGDEKTSVNTLNTSYLTFDQTSTDAARIYIMTNSVKGTETIPVVAADGYTEHLVKVNITECLLYNATFDVDFDFRGSEQTRKTSVQWLNPVFMALGSDLWKPKDPKGELSYAGLMSAFGRVLAGVSYADHYGSDRTVASSYKIISIDWTRAEAVQAGLEQLFQNITLSLFSDDTLIKNSSMAAMVPVTVTSWPITYVYSRLDLLLPYGLAALATLVCACIGTRAFFLNQASYQNAFSTFIRAANETTLKNVIEAHDVGADPLPKHLAQTNVSISRNLHARFENDQQPV